MKKLKPLILLGMLLSVSCANQSIGVTIEKFYPLGAGCDFTTFAEDRVAGNGYLDVAAGAPQFFIGLRIIGGNLVTQRPVSVGPTVLEAENRDRPIVRQQVVTYKLSKAVGTKPKQYITNISLPFTTDGVIFGSFQLISPELGTQLFDGLNPSTSVSDTTADYVDIEALVEFTGEMSASRTPFSTGQLSFPIRAYRSSPMTCTNGYQRFPVDPATGVPDFCAYAGQATSQLVPPPPPSCCPAMGAAGC